MPRKGYSSITLPDKVVTAIRKKINEPNSLYTSVSDFMKEAIREKFEKLSSPRATKHKQRTRFNSST